MLVAVAHGSRNPAAQANIRALLDAVRAARPGLDVREAYIELASPLLPEVLADVPGEVAVVPLLLGNGYHIAHDVAGAAAFHRPGAGVAPALGPDDLLVDALADRLAEAEYCPVCPPPTNPVVLAVAGSSDPRSHADADAVAAVLAARLGREVVAAYNSSTTPSVVETVAALRAAGHHRVSAATYLLSPGRFATEIKACGADLVSDPLGVHPALVELVLRRYDAARASSRSLQRSTVAG
ncbi:sirohydrochlorin chelatase [Sporichthya sp.]|uniref:sirohydrochlorin chelatase n=1 Tax=Sporichthya sp. TaxID=65475 RepID=UPI00184BF288|nr:CbiX/SirB N-terminal domain-containing protein [Sporichthya sp.]MBA3744970.1 sirohydrochlorin chelatase [Sporichthya sp.]